MVTVGLGYPERSIFKPFCPIDTEAVVECSEHFSHELTSFWCVSLGYCVGITRIVMDANCCDSMDIAGKIRIFSFSCTSIKKIGTPANVCDIDGR